MSEIESIKKELEKIKERNRRVEGNKAWEMSSMRKVLLLTTTYFVAGITFVVIGNSSPWVNAIIPTIGFYISTLTFSYVKMFWIKHFYKY